MCQYILYREALKTVGLNSLSWGGRSSLTNPKHKVERTQKNKKAESATRPNQSSDLNPIENSRQCLTNLNNLEQIFTEYRAKITLDWGVNLVMQQCCKTDFTCSKNNTEVIACFQICGHSASLLYRECQLRCSFEFSLLFWVVA